MFLKGNIYGCEAAYSAYVQSPVKKLAIAADFDPIYYKHQLKDLGLANATTSRPNHASILSVSERYAQKMS